MYKDIEKYDPQYNKGWMDGWNCAMESISCQKNDSEKEITDYNYLSIPTYYYNENLFDETEPILPFKSEELYTSPDWKYDEYDQEYCKNLSSLENGENIFSNNIEHEFIDSPIKHNEDIFQNPVIDNNENPVIDNNNVLFDSLSWFDEPIFTIDPFDEITDVNEYNVDTNSDSEEEFDFETTKFTNEIYQDNNNSYYLKSVKSSTDKQPFTNIDIEKKIFDFTTDNVSVFSPDNKSDTFIRKPRKNSMKWLFF